MGNCTERVARRKRADEGLGVSDAADTRGINNDCWVWELFGVPLRIQKRTYARRSTNGVTVVRSDSTQGPVAAYCSSPFRFGRPGSAPICLSRSFTWALVTVIVWSMPSTEISFWR